jgi:hypothetical protein
MFQEFGADKEVRGDLSRWNPPLWRASLEAIGRASVIVTFGAAAVLFLVIAGVWRSAAGFWVLPGAVLVLGVVNAASPAYWRRVRQARVEGPLDLPDPAMVNDGTAQAIVRRLREASERLERARSHSPFGEGHALSRGNVALRDLERRAVILVARLEHIQRLLSDDAPARLGGELERLHAACDGRYETSTSYQRATEAAAWHQSLLQRLEGRRAQVLAELEYLVGVIEALPAQLTELDLQRVEARDEGADLSLTEALEFWQGLDERSLPSSADRH